MIKQIHIENFKAINKAAEFSLQPFTVFIGNNGSGKSSIMEAMRVLQTAAEKSLQEAFLEWEGLEKIRNYNAALDAQKETESGFARKFESIVIGLTAEVNGKEYQYEAMINTTLNEDFYVVEREELFCKGEPVFVSDIESSGEYATVKIFKTHAGSIFNMRFKADGLVLAYRGSPPLSSELEEFREYIGNWQFLYMDAHLMGVPIPQRRTFGDVKLAYNGQNIADYIEWIRSKDIDALESIIRKMNFVLPYLDDLQPHIQETNNKAIELLLYEKSDKSKPLPGWLLSSGTLRVLALLALFDSPKMPSVLFVDEIENGLDPRTIGLLISEIQSVFADKSMQVISATHSPYFLDLVPLESIIVSEKEDKGGSTYHIPKDEESLKIWREKFSPGKLYTMGKLTNN